MLGIVIALVCFWWNFLLMEGPLEPSLVTSLNVLWYLQIAFTALTILTSFVMMFVGSQALMRPGLAREFGKLVSGKLYGSVTGFALTHAPMLILAFCGITILSRALMLGGTWLMLQSCGDHAHIATFDIRHLVAGATLTLTGVWISRMMNASVT